MSNFTDILAATSLQWPMPVRLRPDQAMFVYRQIEKMIEKSFRECHKYGIIEVDWDSVKYCLGVLKEHYAESRLMWKTIYLLFQYFEKYQNLELLPMIADVLYFVLFDTFYARHVIGDTGEHLTPVNKTFPSVLTNMYSLEEHNSVWTLMRMPYRSDLTDVVPRATNLVWVAANTIDTHRLLPILLRQGLLYIPPSSHQNEWSHCNQVLRAIW